MMMQDNKGFTLIESLVAIVILSMGILAVGAMQTNSIRANATANARSQAHAVALSFVEVLQELSFTDEPYIWQDTNGTDDLNFGQEEGESFDHVVREEDFQESGVFATLSDSYSVSEGELTDNSGRVFEVFWNVADEETVTAGNTKIIRMFVRWKSPMGDNKSVITFAKYNDSNIIL